MSCDMASLQFYACAKERQRKAVLTKSFLATMSQELVEEVKDKQAPDPPTAPQLYVIITAGNSCIMHFAPIIYSESECDGEASGEVQQLSSRQMIEQNLEEMITEMNAKRSRDQTLLESMCILAMYVQCLPWLIMQTCFLM